jgi:septum formation protein
MNPSMIEQLEEIVLASGSPRRQQMLREVGITFTIAVSDINEDIEAGESPQAMVERLAVGKARAIAKLHKSRWVIGADTTVFVQNEILAKPVDRQDATRMLKLLAGSTHQVWSSFALVNWEKREEYYESLRTDVTFTPMTEREISNYIDNGEPMDKAGAYAFQGIGAMFIKKIEGSHTNVIGLPLPEVIAALKSKGVLR